MKYFIPQGVSFQLEPKLKALKNDEIQSSTREIKEEIEEINKKLSQKEKETILQEADADNPPGFTCVNTIIEVKELKYVDQVRCYNTSEEICSMVIQ